MSTEQAQRDAKGQFLLGNMGGPGNPFARQVSALRQALLNTVTPEDMQQIASKLVSLAKEGNLQATKLLLAYAIGKPQSAPSPDRMDADEWEVFREQAPMQQEAPRFMQSCDPEFYLRSVRVAQPGLGYVMRHKVRDMFNETPEQRQARETREAEEMERILKSPAPPGNNGRPSPNGKKRRSPNGKRGKQPSPNGKSGRHEPSTNGDCVSVCGDSPHEPSTNGDCVSVCGDSPPQL